MWSAAPPSMRRNISSPRSVWVTTMAAKKGDEEQIGALAVVALQIVHAVAGDAQPSQGGVIKREELGLVGAA